MKVSFDLDGTITRHLEVFVAFGTALRAAGHEVFILTGIPRRVFESERKAKYPQLSQEGWYDDVLTCDLYNENERRLAAEVIAGRLDNHVLVGIYKQRVCREMGIAVHFDDDVAHVRMRGGVPVFGVAK